MGYAVDVVTVPDFDGPAATRFELYTLLFLAAWVEHQGASRTWPLHLACIGEPPASVRRLAEEAGASVTVHDPLLLTPGRTSNKLRGFEVAAMTGRILLVDIDVLILRDLSPLADLVGGGLGVGPATVNHFPEETWRRIYQAVGIPYPGPTGTCWCQDDRLADFRRLTEEQRAMCRRMPPYFNSGMVMAPGSLDFGTLWARHLRQIVRLFNGGVALPNWGGGGEGDEHALATAVEACRQRGTSVVPIPQLYHARPLLLRSGLLTWTDVAAFHYHNALKAHARDVHDMTRLAEVIPPDQRSEIRAFYEYVDHLYLTRIQPVLGGAGAL
ncbi:MAG: hypothetical protein QN187_07620 [Armatimonadota bacterium]|nr:hypothetical protein [Armatimonadota bacterium]MDR7519583.1 hypothetical protein [Armatimonadota bacterium]MDR7549075.1 hypothetical protein [Armatimonadota bacterium]